MTTISPCACAKPGGERRGLAEVAPQAHDAHVRRARRGAASARANVPSVEPSSTKTASHGVAERLRARPAARRRGARRSAPRRGRGRRPRSRLEPSRVTTARGGGGGVAAAVAAAVASGGGGRRRWRRRRWWWWTAAAEVGREAESSAVVEAVVGGGGRWRREVAGGGGGAAVVVANRRAVSRRVRACWSRCRSRPGRARCRPAMQQRHDDRDAASSTAAAPLVRGEAAAMTCVAASPGRLERSLPSSARRAHRPSGGRSAGDLGERRRGDCCQRHRRVRAEAQWIAGGASYSWRRSRSTRLRRLEREPPREHPEQDHAERVDVARGRSGLCPKPAPARCTRPFRSACRPPVSVSTPTSARCRSQRSWRDPPRRRGCSPASGRGG